MVEIAGRLSGTLAASLLRETEQLPHGILDQKELLEICVLCQIEKPYRFKYVDPEDIQCYG